MEAKLWQQINDLFAEALKRRPEDRAAFLEQACDGDETLRKEVDSLLAADDPSNPLFETPAVDKAARLFEKDDRKRGLLPETVLLNRYRILSRIGQGGMGTVYEALDQHVNCLVALKETSANIPEDTRKAFEREAALLGNLHHPALPRVTDYFSEFGRDFLVMEFITGTDLAAHLEETDEPCELDKVLEWADVLLGVLDYLHEQNPPILHRDIKPGNLKLNDRGEIFLLDFGLAKGFVGRMKVSVGKRSIMGYTKVYAPVEQMRFKGTDARSDLYSLGATLYHLITATRPVDAETRCRALDANEVDPLVRMEKLNNLVPVKVADIVHHAMAVRREDRISSASEMLQQLRTARDQMRFKQVRVFCPSCHAPVEGDAERCGLCNAPMHSPKATEIESSNWTIGGDPDGDIFIDNPRVSWQHCRLTAGPDGYWLEDLGSTNGVYVNQVRISQRVKVTQKDQITLGHKVVMPWPALKPAPKPKPEQVQRFVTIGREADNDVQLDFPMISSHHARIVWTDEGPVIEDLNSTNGTAIGNPDQKIKSAHLASTDIVFLGSYRVPAAKLLEGESAHGERAGSPVDFKGTSLTLGRDPQCDQVLDYPMVSWRHARLTRENDDIFVEDLGSTNGTFVNSQRITTRVKINKGDVIGLGSYTFRLTEFGQIEKRDFRGDLTIEIKNVGVTAGGRELLSDVSLTIFPTELVGLMGPAGAGKSTLMNAMNGYARPTTGQVLFNGQSLYQSYSQFSGQIGYVPQDDIMHRDLTVRQALYYTARLRLPSDFEKAEIEKRISKVISQLGLESAQDVVIGSPEKKGISGGQRKRVNLAMELLTDPSVLFLDEPTSGLSSEDAHLVMKLLRELANSGKTILITIHQPSIDIYRLMDNLIVIGKEWNSSEPGRLVYYGPAHPQAQRFFNPEGFSIAEYGSAKPDHPRPEEVLRGLAKQPTKDWSERYRASEYQHRYVVERSGRQSEPVVKSSEPSTKREAGVGQWKTLVKRSFAIKRRDRWMTAILLAQAPIIAIFIWMVLSKQLAVEPFGSSSSEWSEVASALSSTIFMMTVAGLWFGCSNSAREIVGEWAIYHRERMVNLKIPSYVASKFTVLGTLCALQCAVLLGFVYLTCNLKGPIVPMYLVLLLTSLVGVALGLTASTLARSSEAAIALVPLILLPMIILAGALFPIHKMPLPFVAHIMPSRWAFEGLLLQEVQPHGEFAQPAINCSDTSVSTLLAQADMAYSRFPSCSRNLVVVDVVVLVLMLTGLVFVMLVVLKRRDIHR
jgi:ABC transport system ATP-binding/permease protein